MKKNIIDKEISEIIKDCSSNQQDILKLFLNGDNFSDIAIKFNSSKQAVDCAISAVTQKLFESKKIRNFCDKVFDRSDIENIYIDTTAISPIYARLFVKIAKRYYPGMNMCNKFYITSEKKSKAFAILLKKVIDKKGFPFPIVKPDKYGNIDRSTFLVRCSRVEWIFNADGYSIIANPRISFIQNAFLYQIAMPTSLWELFSRFQKNKVTQKILTKDKLLSFRDLSLYVAFRLYNYNKLDETFHISLVVPKKESPFDFALYEFSKFEISKDELINKVSILQGKG